MQCSPLARREGWRPPSSRAWSQVRVNGPSRSVRPRALSVHIPVCPGFIAFTAVPFFFQRSVVESINAHAMLRFVDSVENSMRLHAVLRSGATLAAAATDEPIDSQATHLRQVVTTSYRLLERKLFTLPRLALLPGALVGHPVASAAGMATAVAFDGAKAKAVAFITLRIENLNRESRKLSSKRSRVEAHDSQHAGLLRGARAEAFTRAHWQALTMELQDLTKRTRALEGVRMWIRWLFWQDVVVSPHTESNPETHTLSPTLTRTRSLALTLTLTLTPTP